MTSTFQGLYPITDTESMSFETILVKSEEILRAGVQLLQYRDKCEDTENKIDKAKQLLALCQRYSVPLIINDDVELAEFIGADGVHLGKDDAEIETARNKLGEQAIIGYSCYNDMERAAHAADSGASYIAFGAFFPSPTKPNAVKAETALIIEAKQRFDLPVVAIGGITPENGKPLVDAGANMLAVVSGLYAADDSYNKATEYNHLFN